MDYPHTTKAIEYAEGVISGEIVAGKLAKNACKRFISDLEQAASGDSDYYFSSEKAEKACRFIEKLPHTKGRWASKGETMRLEGWQSFIVVNIFGWLRLKDDLRRFREVYCEIARKNGKSALASAIGLYMFLADDEYGAEVYSGATTERQSWEVFRPAREICKRTPALVEHYDVEVNAKNLNVMSNGARFEPLIGKPGDGASPSCAIVDEYHEHDTPDLYETMQTGMGAREQPLMFVITTAGSNLGGACYEKRRDVVRILDGSVQDDTIFAIIFAADEDDQWDSEEALRKANPNYDVSVSGDFLLQQMAIARRSASKQNHFKTKHLNLWVGARTAWMNMLAWQRQKKSGLTLSDFAGEPCRVACDLANKTDVAAISILFKRDNKSYLFSKYYAPEGAAEENDKYREFETTGHLTITPGNATDYGFIEEEIKQLATDFDVIDVAFDPWQASYLSTRLAAEGLEVVEYRQTVQNMSEPMKEIEAEVLDDRFYHDGNPVTTWMVGNVVAKMDAKENVYPRKENDNDKHCKIDGVVAAIMAMGRAMLDEDNSSAYDERELLIV